MSVWVWLSVSLPVTAAMLYLYFTIREAKLRLVVKGSATWVVLMTAVVGQALFGRLPAGWLMILAVALFVLADVLLNVRFMQGVAAFGLGHAALIAWMLAQRLPLNGWSIPVGVLLYAGSVFFFRNSLGKAGKKAIGMLVYAAVLTTMASVALMTPLSGGVTYAPFAAGAALFVISDLMVAKGVLVGVSRRTSVATMILYESAVMLMALSCW